MITGPLFTKIFNCKKKIIVCQGGGDAGKTVAILQTLALKAIQYPRSVTTITGQDTPNLKGGALRAFQKYVESDPEIKSHIHGEHNRTDRIFTFNNGSIIEFKSFDNEEDARGSERDFLFVNEATNLSYNLFWQLQRKTRIQVFIDYNPTQKFWCHSMLLSNNLEYYGKVQLYITDHRHNPFLAQEDHDNYENISDADLFRVYSRGLTGKIRGLIFGHFKPVSAIPDDCDKIIWGVDYGYTNDETALVKVGIKGRKRYIKELCYEPGIPPDRLKELIIKNGWKNEPIYSEHDVNIIAQLRRLNLPVFPARKGPGSLAAGIAKVKEFECFYTEDSINLKDEINHYKWVVAQDLSSGKEVMTNIPVDGHDHACQALTYAIYTDSFRQTG